MFQKIKKVMGFKSNNIQIKGVPTNNVGSPLLTDIKLSESELEFLLVTIKNGLFKGEYVEICYNTTLKLQEKYKSFKK